MIFKLFFICSLFLGQLFSAPVSDDNLFESTFTYIVNGTDAKIEEFPWQASMHFNGKHICGSSLINSHWIISAAHCFKQDFNSTEKNRFFFGSDDLNIYYDNPDLGYEIEKIYTHPKFTHGVNDIALIKLKQPVKINNKTIKPICLINENYNQRVYETLMVTGFGRTKEPAGYTSILQKSQYLEDGSFDDQGKIIDSSRIYIQKMGSSSCHGDSGGPLHYITKSLEKYLVGIVSIGDYLCRGPSIYTRVSYHLDFIKQIVDEPICIKNLNEL